MNRCEKTIPDKKSASHVIRARSIVVWGVVIGVCVACPLFAVWKQVYVRDLSMRKTVLTDSLAICNREIGRLKIITEKYSTTTRIENVARERLGLEYPTADRIVVLQPRRTDRHLGTLGDWEFFAILRRSLMPEHRS